MKFVIRRSTESRKAYKQWLAVRDKKEKVEKKFEAAGEKLKESVGTLIRGASIEFNASLKKEGAKRNGIIFAHHYIEGTTLPLRIEIFIDPETCDEAICEQFNSFVLAKLQKDFDKNVTTQVRPDPRSRKNHRLQVVRSVIR